MGRHTDDELAAAHLTQVKDRRVRLGHYFSARAINEQSYFVQP